MNSGKTERETKTSTTPGSRDRMILDDVVRFRLITTDWVHGRYLPDVRLNAVTKITRRLTREGWLTAHRLFQRRHYFTAGERLVRQQGIPPARIRPLGPQALVTHYAALRYCATRTAGVPELQIATVEEVRNSFPWMPQSFLARPQVIVGQGADCAWRLLRIDMGARSDHVARKVQRDINRLMREASFQSLLADGRFTQVILSPSAAKKRLVEQSLSERSWPRGIKFQIGFIPELFQLLAIT